MSKSREPDTDTPPTATLEEALNFEEALEALEGLVAKMEGGEMSLDESLQAFEHGIALTRRCQNALQAAELKVQTLTQEGELIDFDTEDMDDD